MKASFTGELLRHMSPRLRRDYVPDAALPLSMAEQLERLRSLEPVRSAPRRARSVAEG